MPHASRHAVWIFTLLLDLFCGGMLCQADEVNPRELVLSSPRILFLGDSITASGEYVAIVDAWLHTLDDARRPLLINGGLPSETVSGLSEAGHAGGAFPRPDLAERLDRILPLAKPNLVFACYGMNCGIYQPFSEERFTKFKQGIEHLKTQVEKSGAKLVLITPPCFDGPVGDFSYNDVLARYSQWLLSQRNAGWLVIDLHGPMTRELAGRREANPQFTFQTDGVHPNAGGYWYIATQLLGWLDEPHAATFETPDQFLEACGAPKALLPLARQRMAVLRDAYVGAAGHKRPGVAAGMPVDQAETVAKELAGKMQTIVENSKAKRAEESAVPAIKDN